MEGEEGHNRDRWGCVGCEAGLGRRWKRELELADSKPPVACSEMNGGPSSRIGFPFAGGTRLQVALLVRMTASRPKLLCPAPGRRLTRPCWGWRTRRLWSVFQTERPC
jgi:hypothetical protein